MKHNTCGNTHLVIQDDRNEVLGILSSAYEIEEPLLACLRAKFDTENVTIGKIEMPDQRNACFVTVSYIEKYEDEATTAEMSISPAWIYEPEELRDPEVEEIVSNIWAPPASIHLGEKDIIRQMARTRPLNSFSMPDRSFGENELEPDTQWTLTIGDNGERSTSVAPSPLTLEYLKEHLGKIFATGVTTNPILHNGPVRWVAKIGDGLHDWAIYYHTPRYSMKDVAESGDKCTTESVIRSLVPCTDDAWKMYRS